MAHCVMVGQHEGEFLQNLFHNHKDICLDLLARTGLARFLAVCNGIVVVKMPITGTVLPICTTGSLENEDPT